MFSRLTLGLFLSLSYLTTLALGSGFFIVQGSCVDTEKVPGTKGSTRTTWKEARLVPVDKYNCGYLQSNPVEIRNTVSVFDPGYSNAPSFCGRNIDVHHAGEPFNRFIVFDRNLPQTNNANKLGECWVDRKPEITCELNSKVVKTKCKYERVGHCPFNNVC